MIEKRGKDPTFFKNRRDIWMVCHDWTLLTGCGEMEYKRVMEQVIPAYASGFRRWHGPADDTIVIRLQTEAQAAVCMPLSRLFLDLKGFFQGISRPVQFAGEQTLGVLLELIHTFEEVHGMV